MSVAAAVSSVRVWAYCITEYQLGGSTSVWGGQTAVSEVTQVASARTAARQIAREHVRSQLGGDALHGARMIVSEDEVGEGDQEFQCLLRGNRVRRFKDFDPVPVPRPDGPVAVTRRPPRRTVQPGGAGRPPGRGAPGGAGAPRAGPPGGAMTSDLSIDEELLLHSIGWEPVELVAGVSLFSVPMGVWNWGQGEIASASSAFAQAFEAASGRLHRQCARAGGHGVVGVHLDRVVGRHHVDISLLGTAVRPVGAARADDAGLPLRPVRP